MRNGIRPLVASGLAFLVAGAAGANPGVAPGTGLAPGTEEFGLTPRQLVQAIEKVEARIATCMREQGFQYVAADYRTVRRGMSADKNLPGMSEEEFIAKHGYGVSTTYTGQPPQLSDGYNPARVGLGDENIAIFKNLSPTDQVAYNRTLLGKYADATLAVALETEDFSRMFEPDQLKATYYNPKDALINKDPRMIGALSVYAGLMRDEGFDYKHPDEVETDIRQRLDALTDGGTIPVEKMTPAQLAALAELQDYERRVAVKDYELAVSIFDPVEERIEKELYARPVK
jgi:hypothetical protein